jgi:carbonic anhydrase
MSVTDELLQNNAAYAESFDKGDLPLPPARGVAVVAFMDARLDVHKILVLQEGDAHVIRNAGGVITDDEIRSLTISQHLLGTREIVLNHHTDCGMLTFTDDELRQQIQEEAGTKPHFPMESFSDLEEDMRQSIARIQASPSIPLRRACAALSTRWRPAGWARLPNLYSGTFESGMQGGQSPSYLARWRTAGGCK